MTGAQIVDSRPYGRRWLVEAWRPNEHCTFINSTREQTEAMARAWLRE